MKLIIPLLAALLLSVCLLGYVMNIYKFAMCDFTAPYKCEVIHGLGLFPVVGIVTGYLIIKDGVQP